MGKKSRFILLLLSAAFTSFAQPGPSAAQSKDEASIRQMLADQTDAWNKGDLDNFMKGYWHNDSLVFIGQSGVTYGYANALNNYRKNYISPGKMGKLFFTLLKVQRLSPDHYFVIGKWFLKRTVGDVGGVYTLLFRKIGGQWWIIADHSS
ncbi:MAG TPA: DUF4440 domain-containing protein [Puia sp.]|jgi:ketosteroid isomerase-like protein